MRKLQNRRWLKRLIYSRAAVILLAVLVVFVGRAAWQMYGRYRAVTVERQALAERLAELRSRQAALEADLAALQTPRGLEEKIREQFPVARAGEEVITVAEEEPSEESPAAAETATKTWWQRFVDLFR